MELYYFGYGMNTNAEEMRKRCPTSHSPQRAILHDYRLRFARHCDIVPAWGDKVDGVLWRLQLQDLESLNRLEGYPNYYDRKVVDVYNAAGRIKRAEVYFMQPGNTLATPSLSYFTMCMEGYEQHGVPTDQLYRAMREAKRAEELRTEYGQYTV